MFLYRYRWVVLGMVMSAAAMPGCTCKQVVTPPNQILDPALSERAAAVQAADPMVSQQWSASKIGLDQVWADASQQGTRRVSVAVLSTGIDYNHEDLRQNIWVNPVEGAQTPTGMSSPMNGKDDDDNGYVDDVAGYDFVDGDGLPYDRNGLGTAAAGIIGAVASNGKGVRGVAANVSMIPVRYIDGSGATNFARLISALKYSADVRADVVFLHLAKLSYAQGLEQQLDPSDPEQAKQIQEVAQAEEATLRGQLDRLAKANVPMLVTAGNSGVDLGQDRGIVKTIASYGNVAFVTSVDESDKRPFISNYGMEVVLTSAPGENILTTLPGNQYSKESGTFASTAYVTGAVALGLSQAYGKYTAAELLGKLGRPEASDALPAMQYESIGANRLNVAKYLAATRAP